MDHSEFSRKQAEVAAMYIDMFKAYIEAVRGDDTIQQLNLPLLEKGNNCRKFWLFLQKKKLQKKIEKKKKLIFLDQ